MVVARGWRWRGKHNCCSRDTEFQFYEMKKLQGSVVQQCAYSEHYCSVHLKMAKMVTFYVTWFLLHTKVIFLGFPKSLQSILLKKFNR